MMHINMLPDQNGISAVQPFEEAAFLAFSQREAGVSKEATRRKQATELSLAVRCVSLVGNYRLHLLSAHEASLSKSVCLAV